MGLFQSKNRRKRRLQEEGAHEVEHFFDEYFREELKNHGRWYFEKVISENGTLFKQDLDSTLSELNTDLREYATKQLDQAIAQINNELKQYITDHIDQQINEYTRTAKEAQSAALASLEDSAQSMRSTASEHEALFKSVFEEGKAQVDEIKNSQRQSLELLNSSVEALQRQNDEIRESLKSNIESQQSAIMDAFQENMSQIIEHHLLEVVGEQYDLKDQLPSIIRRMEENKQAIVDDMKI